VTPRDRVLAALDLLEPDALEVVALVAERLVVGRASYGALDVMASRDWVGEGLEELVDGLSYLSCAVLRTQQRAIVAEQSTLSRYSPESEESTE
jgi:hypothetical protein